MKDARPRIITGVLLIGFVLGGCFFAPPWFFQGVLGGLLYLAAIEWARLSGLKTEFSQRLYGAFFIGLMIGCVQFPSPIEPLQANWMVVAAWGVAFGWLLQYRGTPHAFVRPIGARALYGVVALLPVWLGLLYLYRTWGPSVVLSLFTLIWSVDVGAYFVGRAWGRHRLAPSISPGKTWEGLLGGLIFTAVTAFLLRAYLPALAVFAWGPWFGWSLLTALAGVVGDLWESMMKRIAGVKDSGRLLPGHGGILDRIDSLTAGVPVFTLACLLTATA
ncbi:hypothetical protein EBZ35_07695 [bacterium]|nr:hypothetical protein [bacterium]